MMGSPMCAPYEPWIDLGEPLNVDNRLTKKKMPQTRKQAHKKREAIEIGCGQELTLQ